MNLSLLVVLIQGLVNDKNSDSEKTVDITETVKKKTFASENNIVVETKENKQQQYKSSNSIDATNQGRHGVWSFLSLFHGPPSPIMSSPQEQTLSFLSSTAPPSDTRHYSFVNSRGVTLYGTSWSEMVSVVGLVYISHGYAEHMGYYHHLGKALAQAGLVAFGHDHEGHGQSGGERVNIADYQYYVSDIFQDIHLWRQRHPGLPVFLFGHSMGGLIATLASIEKPDIFRGVVLTGPQIRSEYTHGVTSSISRKLAKVAAEVAPSFEAGGSIPLEEVTSNTRIVRQMEKDDLYWKGEFKARFTLATFQAVDRVKREELRKVVVPLLVLHASEDKITDPQGSQLLVAEATSEDKKVRMMEGQKHHLILEPEGYTVVRHIVDWIILRIGWKNL